MGQTIVASGAYTAYLAGLGLTEATAAAAGYTLNGMSVATRERWDKSIAVDKVIEFLKGEGLYVSDVDCRESRRDGASERLV
jgi:hypothetical protein